MVEQTSWSFITADKTLQQNHADIKTCLCLYRVEWATGRKCYNNKSQNTNTLSQRNKEKDRWMHKFKWETACWPFFIVKQAAQWIPTGNQYNTHDGTANRSGECNHPQQHEWHNSRGRKQQAWQSVRASAGTMLYSQEAFFIIWHNTLHRQQGDWQASPDGLNSSPAFRYSYTHTPAAVWKHRTYRIKNTNKASQADRPRSSEHVKFYNWGPTRWSLNKGFTEQT